MPDLDVLAMLRAHLTPILAATVTDLPGDLDSRLPMIQVQELVPTTRHVAMQGHPLTDLVPVDIDVFAGSLEAAADLARYGTPNLRDTLDAWAPQGLSILTRTVPSRRPDRNPHVFRFGCVYTFLAQRG